MQDEMFLAAARALADFVTPEQIEQGQLYPEAKDLRKVAATVGFYCLLPLFAPSSEPLFPCKSALTPWTRLL